MSDEEYMRLALELAGKGCGFVAPNPMVGAVIVKDGRIIGQGYHERYGETHAERNALAACTEPPQGATMYVTLEPCCHYGKQPPCVDAILEAGISRVVIGSHDPNPLVSGEGARLLRENGVSVTRDVLRKECDSINQVFFHFIQSGKPYVVMKYAMTMDGKIATRTGKSKWITGEAARKHVHEQRHRYSAIMVGSGTVLADDPMLTCRIEGGRNPLRIICDTGLRIPVNSQVVETAGEVPTLLATCCSELEKQQAFIQKGCQILVVSEENGHLNLRELMNKLGEMKVDSILLEGGATLNWAALQSGIVQRVQTYISPKLFGGETAKTPVGGLGVDIPSEAVRLKNSCITRLEEDFLIESEVESGVYGNY